jgi:hypothetical protein
MDSVLVAVSQWGAPGIIGVILVWLGRTASRFVDRHLASMDKQVELVQKIVDRLDEHGRIMTEHGTKLDSLLVRVRSIQPSIHEKEND